MSRNPWRRIIVENDPDRVEVTPDGNIRQGVRIIMSEEDAQAVKAGYKCVNCLEPLEEAFPVSCFLCGFAVRALQAEYLAQTDIGEVEGYRTGPDFDRVADEMEERRERRAFEKRASESNIVVPRALP